MSIRKQSLDPEPNPTRPRIIVCDRDWAAQAAEYVLEGLTRLSREKPRGVVMLTGGKSAEKVYLALSEHPAFQEIAEIDFLFGDERCVAPHSEASNYGMAMRTLFRNGIPVGSHVERMVGDNGEPGAAAVNYESRVPDSVDMLLLGIGRDGHIASLFPYEASLNEHERKVIPVDCPVEPRQRITITPAVIARARDIILLAPGADKAEVLVEALRKPDNTIRMPVRMVLHATWLLDRPLLPRTPGLRPRGPGLLAE